MLTSSCFKVLDIQTQFFDWLTVNGTASEVPLIDDSATSVKSSRHLALEAIIQVHMLTVNIVTFLFDPKTIDKLAYIDRLKVHRAVFIIVSR